MKYLKNSIYIIGLSLLAISCNNASSNSVTVKGEVQNASKVYYGILKKGDVIGLDTADVVDNKFTLTHTIDSVGNIYMLSFDKGQNRIVLIPHNGETIEIKYDTNNEGGVYDISGSEESEAVQTINASLKATLDKLDSLNVIGKSLNDSDIASITKLRLAADSILGIQKEYLRTYIDNNSESLTAMFALYQPHPYGNGYLLNIEEEFEYYEKVSQGLHKNFPKSEHSKYLVNEVESAKKRVEAAKKTEVGAVAPDISLQSPAGEELKLSDLRGKVVLLDFWASWCKPCRYENPNVVKAYNKYADQGFEVYSVSIDGRQGKENAKAQWIAAIAQDQLPWKNHVLDFGGLEVASPLYNVQSIPNTFLLDRNGIIIAKNLRGPALEAKLEEVL